MLERVPREPEWTQDRVIAWDASEDDTWLLVRDADEMIWRDSACPANWTVEELAKSGTVRRLSDEQQTAILSALNPERL